MSDLKMARHRKVEWVRALRSGRYQQGTGALLTYDNLQKDTTPKHCCLGVLCEVVGLKPSRQNTYLGDGSLLPELVWKGVGLPGSHVLIPTGNSMNRPYKHDWSLAELNDNGLSFNEIADIIDYFIEGVEE